MTRCQDCLADATHTLKWEHARWTINKVHRAPATLPAYCRWHATVHAQLCQATGLQGMAQWRQLLRQEARE